MTFQSLPTYDSPIIINGKTSSVWYRFFQGVFQGKSSGNEVSVTVSASPFTYTAPSGGFLIIQGGTVSSVVFKRNSSHNTGATQGLFPVSSQDILIITYSVLPTVTFVPQ